MAQRITLPEARGLFVRVTIRVFYALPDWPRLVSPHPLLLQEDDEGPGLPRINKFLGWWEENLEGRIRTVEFGWVPLSEIRGKSTVRTASSTFIFN